MLNKFQSCSVTVQNKYCFGIKFHSCSPFILILQYCAHIIRVRFNKFDFKKFVKKLIYSIVFESPSTPAGSNYITYAK